ncbi:hypothetical protein SFC43_00520 [Bacteroides sp. CR5/BHMF/2]|nr:hypothetical protein [Bacteroides sp. CR5/BHMF/2]
MKTISLNGKDFSLKYTLRAFFVFESISGYPFQFGKMLDEFLCFIRSCLPLIRNCSKWNLREFIELCENDLTLFEQFKEFILDEIKLRSQSAGNDVKKEGDNAETKAVSIRELYSRVVGEGGIALDYFLDKMDFIEVESFIDGLNRRNRESWEQTRLLGYIIAQSNSTKTLKQTDILRFPWDDATDENKDTSVTDEEIERLRAKAKIVESQLNANKDV